MVSVNLPEPILSLALEPVARIKQNDEVAVGGLWSVLSKVKSAVTDGRRLENLTWRLWYQARRASMKVSSIPLSQSSSICQDAPSRPPLLSSPSLTLSSSSEDTNTSSDWDRETAVNEDEELQPRNADSAHRKAVVSPPTKSLEFARLSFSSAPPGVVPLSQATIAVENRQLPPASTQLSLHHSLDIIPDTRIETHRPHGSAPSSDACHQSSSTSVPSLTPHLPVTPHASIQNDSKSRICSFNTISRTASPSSGQAVLDGQFLAASKVPFSAPATPPIQQERQTVGDLVAIVLLDKTMKTRFDRNVRVLAQPRTSQDQIPTIPEIVEPGMPAPPSPYTQAGASLSLSASSAFASATSTPRQIFPTVIVVNPTPHPTPPATPSQDISEPSFNLTATTAFPINLSEKLPGSGNVGSVNGQLGTPISVNGDANPAGQMVAGDNQMYDMNEIRSGHTPPLHERKENDVGMLLGPASMIVLPKKSIECDISSHLPTPAAEVSHGLSPVEMGSTARISSPAPIPAPQPTEEKKFFLAAPLSGSGGSSHSTESPDSTQMGSLSPSRRGGIHRVSTLARESGRQREEQRQEEITSSFSACSPTGRPPSVTSSKGGIARKGPTFTVAGGSKRRQGARQTALFGRDNHRREASQTDYHSDREKEVKDKMKEKAKAKETDNSNAPTSILGHRTKSLQHIPSHRSNLAELAPHQLRQLPTNPPPLRQASPTRRNNIPPLTESHAQASTINTQYNNRHLSQFPLGHLPTVPPRQRRPIEITSSDYSTTDTDDGGSSWESESYSGEESKRDRLSNSRDVAVGPSNVKKSDITLKNSRTHDPGAIARDAALEAQRQRELFRKLPPRSYSNLSQLSRTKSGLSILFNPDPRMLPEGHPYRTSQSTQDLPRNWSAPAPPLAMTSIAKRVEAAAPVPDNVTVASVNSKADLAGTVNGRRLSGTQGHGYRPRAKPADQEEETETDEDPEDAIQVSSSVAERRLAALVGARTRRSPSQGTSQQSQSPPAQPMTRIATMPVDMMRQYLVEPAPLQTPHTIRKNIISQELNEDLRRTLLSERSYNNQIQGRPPRAPGSILPGPWRPLTPMKTTAEEQKPFEDSNKRSFATQRTKSWAGDYHAHGW